MKINHKTSQQRLLKILTLIFSGWVLTTPSLSTSLNQAKQNLSQISQRISLIKHTIEQKVEQHQNIKLKINQTESKLEKNKLEQIKIKGQIAQTTNLIQQLQHDIQKNQQQIEANRQAIFQHLKLAIQFNREPYWHILFSAKNPFEYYQQLELHQYLYDSEQKQLQQLKDNENTLAFKQKQLTDNQSKLIRLQQLLAQNEKQILAEKQNHQQTLKLISDKINENTSQLHQAEQAQQNLKKLITSLLKNNTLQSHKPFSVMRRKLNFPLYEHQHKTQKVQNGLIFIANNGTSVHAVSAGKVVFADWLNGYGYLAIIDHGWGFMTLYGNNQRLVKHKGDMVKQGEVIALVGNSGTFHQTGLYFEIRQKAHVIAASSWFKDKIS